MQPLIKPKGIDDVPIVTLTFWSRDSALGAHELGQIARAAMSEIKRVPGTRNVYAVGDSEPMIRVELDPQRLTAAGLTVTDLAAALQAANLVRQADGVVDGGRAGAGASRSISRQPRRCGRPHRVGPRRQADLSG